MTISFNNIPVGLLTGGVYVEVDNSKAIGGLVTQPHVILLIGQRLSSGEVAANVPTQLINSEQAINDFGRGSMIADMAKTLQLNDKLHETYVIALDDNGSGNEAEGAITIGGTPSKAGTLNVYIAGVRVQVGVAAAETVTSIATKLVTAISANPDLAVTAESTAGVVTLAAKHAGELGNDIDVRTNYFTGESLPSGLTATIVAMSGGSANPDIASAIAAMGDEPYHTIIQPYTDAANLTKITTEMARRFEPLVDRAGMCYTAKAGSQGDLTTLGDSLNSPHVSVMSASGVPTASWNVAASYGGVAAFHGSIDPARPLQTLQLEGVLAPQKTDRFTLEERNQVLTDGIATFTVDAGDRVLVERAVTTYKTNAASLPDPSYRDVNTLLTLAFLRFSVRARISQKFPRHKLADDGTKFGTGQAVVTPSIIKSELIALFRDWESAGLAENIDQFKTDLLVERDETDQNRVNAIIPPDIINQFRVLGAKLEFRL